MALIVDRRRGGSKMDDQVDVAANLESLRHVGFVQAEAGLGSQRVHIRG